MNPTIRHNGSPEGMAFVNVFQRISIHSDALIENWVRDLRAAGVKAARYDDGWVDRKINTVYLPPYAHFEDDPDTGDVVALGNFDDFRLVKLGGKLDRMLSDGCRFWFEDVALSLDHTGMKDAPTVLRRLVESAEES